MISVFCVFCRRLFDPTDMSGWRKCERLAISRFFCAGLTMPLQTRPRTKFPKLGLSCDAQLEARMEPLQRYRAMAAFCRQRAKMDGEDARFWLGEAESWERLVRNGCQPNPILPFNPDIKRA
jgi:hypothetical protein